MSIARLFTLFAALILTAVAGPTPAGAQRVSLSDLAQRIAELEVELSAAEGATMADQEPGAEPGMMITQTAVSPDLLRLDVWGEGFGPALGVQRALFGSGGAMQV